jgi:hypothetical protein
MFQVSSLKLIFEIDIALEKISYRNFNKFPNNNIYFYALIRNKNYDSRTQYGLESFGRD